MSAPPVDLWNKQVAAGLALRLPLHISHPTRDKFASAIGSGTADGWGPGPLDTSEDQILGTYVLSHDNEQGHGSGSVGASSAYVYERGSGGELRA